MTTMNNSRQIVVTLIVFDAQNQSFCPKITIGTHIVQISSKDK